LPTMVCPAEVLIQSSIPSCCQTRPITAPRYRTLPRNKPAGYQRAKPRNMESTSSKPDQYLLTDPPGRQPALPTDISRKLLPAEHHTPLTRRPAHHRIDTSPGWHRQREGRATLVRPSLTLPDTLRQQTRKPAVVRLRRPPARPVCTRSAHATLAWNQNRARPLPAQEPTRGATPRKMTTTEVPRVPFTHSGPASPQPRDLADLTPLSSTFQQAVPTRVFTARQQGSPRCCLCLVHPSTSSLSPLA